MSSEPFVSSRLLRIGRRPDARKGERAQERGFPTRTGVGGITDGAALHLSNYVS